MIQMIPVMNVSRIGTFALFFAGLSLWCGNAGAAACDSQATGAWNAAGTWTNCGGTFPGAADTVTIKSPHIVTLDSARTIIALTIDAGGTLTLGNNLLTNTGNVTINGTLDDAIVGGSGGVNITGNASVIAGGGTLTGEARLYTSGTAPSVAVGTTLTFTGATQFRAGRNGGATVAGSVLTINGTLTSTVAGAGNFLRLYANSTIISATGVINAAPSPITYQTNTATLTNNGIVTILNVVGTNAANNWTNAAGSTLNVSGALMATGTLTANAAGNTVNYNGAAQTGEVTTYNNLTLSGSGAKTFATTPTVNNVLSMEGTATAVVTAGVVTYGANATLQYNTTTARTASAEEWITPFAANGGVVIANTGAITLNTAKVFNASVPLTINAGATLATNNLQVTFGGNFVNAGTFTAGSSPIVIANTMAAQSIAGFTTTGLVSLTKTAGTATFTGNVGGGALTINGAGGTLSLGAGLTHTFSGAWTRTAGTLNGGSSTLNIGGNCSGAGGTFTAGTSTVNWNAAGAQTLCAVSYYNLTLSNSGAKTATGVTSIGGSLTISGTATMTGNSALTVAGALNYLSTGSTTLTAATAVSIGTYNQAAGTLIDNGNTITVTGTGASTWSQSGGTFTPTGTVAFTGAAPQIGAANFNNLTINVGAGNSATLTGNVIGTGVLSLTSGRVFTNANILIISSNCTTSVVGGAAANYVFGNLRLHYPTNAGTTTCTFPIGSAAAYTPVTLAMLNVTSTLANSSVTARTDDGDHADTTANTSGIDASKSVNRYWTLIPGGALTFATYDITFNFVVGDIDSGANTGNFAIGRKTAGSWTYPSLGTRNPTNTTATGITQANGFGEFAVGERAVPVLGMLKSTAVFSDPFNNALNPKAIPGAIVTYTVRLTNSGPGAVDSNSVVITDALPGAVDLFVGDIGGVGSGPVLFTDGAPASGLSWTFTSLASGLDSVDFSQDGSVWTYTPVPDANGFDATVRHVRLKPSGTMSAAGGGNPYAEIIFRVRVR